MAAGGVFGVACARLGGVSLLGALLGWSVGVSALFGWWESSEGAESSEDAESSENAGRVAARILPSWAGGIPR